MLTDDQIIIRVQQGERQLFGELHRRHHECIFHFVSRSIWQRESAQDLACDVWLRALCAVDRFQVREGASVLGWLLRIAANLITDYRRRLKPEGEPLDEWESSAPPVLVGPVTEVQFWRRERCRAIQKAFSELPANDQFIIALAHGRGLTSEQIATLLGKPSTSAVTSHLHRAMLHLRSKLRRAGWSEGWECAEAGNRAFIAS